MFAVLSFPRHPLKHVPPRCRSKHPTAPQRLTNSTNSPDFNFFQYCIRVSCERNIFCYREARVYYAQAVRSLLNVNNRRNVHRAQRLHVILRFYFLLIVTFDSFILFFLTLFSRFVDHRFLRSSLLHDKQKYEWSLSRPFRNKYFFTRFSQRWTLRRSVTRSAEAKSNVRYSMTGGRNVQLFNSDKFQKLFKVSHLITLIFKFNFIYEISPYIFLNLSKLNQQTPQNFVKNHF